jgi:hypothetical protein
MTSKFFLLYLFLIGFWTTAQTSKFKLTGEIINHSTSKKESGVRVVIYQNGSQIKEVSSNTNGIYAIEHQMDVTRTFEVAFQKNGFFSKKVLFNLSKVEPSKIQNLEPIDISMVSNSGGNELTFLETEPLQKITSIPLYNEDIKYRDNMQNKIIAALSTQGKKTNPTNEIYDRGINKAWDLLNDGKLDEAQKLAENYIVLNPKHPEPQKILDAIKNRSLGSMPHLEDTTKKNNNVNQTINDSSLYNSTEEIDIEKIKEGIFYSNTTRERDFETKKSNSITLNTATAGGTKELNNGQYKDTTNSREFNLDQYNIDLYNNQVKDQNYQESDRLEMAKNVDYIKIQAAQLSESKEAYERNKSIIEKMNIQNNKTLGTDTNVRNTTTANLNTNTLNDKKDITDGVTEERKINKDARGKVKSVIIRRTVVKNGEINIYELTTGNGYNTYTKNGNLISAAEWAAETAKSKSD